MENGLISDEAISASSYYYPGDFHFEYYDDPLTNEAHDGRLNDDSCWLAASELIDDKSIHI